MCGRSFESRRKEGRLHTTADGCFGVSLSLYRKPVMCLDGTGLRFGGFLVQVPVADQKSGKWVGIAGEDMFRGPMSKVPNPEMLRTHVQAAAYSL